MRVCVLLLLMSFLCVSSKVVDFSQCREFFFKGQPPVISGIQENSRCKTYKTICQNYEGKYRFATLYDTKNRIPVFSAYKFTLENRTKRPRIPWMIEPELEPVSDEMAMPYVNQAMNEDYLKNNNLWNHGHLFPCCHAADYESASSTFTLTNIVPQRIRFNNGSWNRMEIETSNEMLKNCRDETHSNKVLAHVLTGAVPGKNTLNERVNIPSFMWMTFCCFNISSGSYSSRAYWARNTNENSDDVTIPERSLQELQEFLSKEWVKINQLFQESCNFKSRKIHIA